MRRASWPSLDDLLLQLVDLRPILKPLGQDSLIFGFGEAKVGHSWSNIEQGGQEAQEMKVTKGSLDVERLVKVNTRAMKA
jgi:hypothetical protein